MRMESRRQAVHPNDQTDRSNLTLPFIARRQSDAEGRAPAEPALDLDCAVEQLDQPFRDREPESYAAQTSRRRAFDLPERIEDKGDRLLRDADAGVAHLDRD